MARKARKSTTLTVSLLPLVTNTYWRRVGEGANLASRQPPAESTHSNAIDEVIQRLNFPAWKQTVREELNRCLLEEKNRISDCRKKVRFNDKKEGCLPRRKAS